jgi:hypothetical protein
MHLTKPATCVTLISQNTASKQSGLHSKHPILIAIIAMSAVMAIIAYDE